MPGDEAAIVNLIGRFFSEKITGTSFVALVALVISPPYFFVISDSKPLYWSIYFL